MCAKTRQIRNLAAKLSCWRLANEGKISTKMFSESPGDDGEWLHRTRFSEAEKIPQTG